MWVKAVNYGVNYSISESVINLLRGNALGESDVVSFIIAMFNNARLFGVPGDVRSVYVHGRVSYRHVYGYVMYIRRYNSVSIHISSGRIRHDFSNCAVYWGWQVLAHEIAHLVGVGGGHYLRHSHTHLNVARELLLTSLPAEVAAPSVYYLLIDYSLSNCKRGYSRVSRDFVLNELNRVINDHAIDAKHYLNCSDKLRSIINSCSRYARKNRRNRRGE
ncbi:hypothetical protein Vsou_06120 [Vulcanisaeta souniana JCM 11219]|nr:hypothetical protein Vsou_06120 [Vulcanisaeta souniana JCM 11219]